MGMILKDETDAEVKKKAGGYVALLYKYYKSKTLDDIFFFLE